MNKEDFIAVFETTLLCANLDIIRKLVNQMI